MIRINLLKGRPAPVDRLPPALEADGSGPKFLTKRETALAIGLVLVGGGVIAAQLSGVFDAPPVDDDEPLVAEYERPDPPPVAARAVEPEASPSAPVVTPEEVANEPTPEPVPANVRPEASEPEEELGAPPEHTVTAIRLVPWGEAVEVRAEVAGEPTYSSFWLSDPERLVVDIEDAELRAVSADLNRSDPHPLISRVRAAQNSFEPARVRLVVETSRRGPVEISSSSEGVSVRLSPTP